MTSVPIARGSVSGYAALIASTDEKVTTERARAKERVRAIVEEIDRPTLACSTRRSTTRSGFASRPWTSPSGSCAGDPMARLPLHCCHGSRRAWGDEPVRDTQAMVPEPNDDPKPDDEPDEETDDEPDEETDEEPNDQPDNDPGTLYFGEDDGWTRQSC
jgi:hypothetical protein